MRQAVPTSSMPFQEFQHARRRRGRSYQNTMHKRLIHIDGSYTYTGMNNRFGGSDTDSNAAELVIS